MTTQTTETRNAVATEILNQLGGSRFTAMTGSKNFGAGENSLSMRLARNKSNAQYLTITLNSLDLYDMKFVCVNRNYEFTVRAERNNVYAEDLQATFTDITGLYTRL
jgi:hypothetical protein